MNVCVLDMQPISPAVGGGRLRLLGLYHALVEGMDTTYIGTYDWPGEPARDRQLTPTLREITVPLSPEHFAAHEILRARAGGKVVIDTTFHQFAQLSPAYLARVREAAEAADAVIFSHPWVYPLVKDVLNRSRQLVVYDSQNVEGYLRMSLLDDGGAGTEIAYEVIRIERELCRAAHMILVCSQEDRVLFQELYDIPCARMELCPNGVFTHAILPVTETERARSKKRLEISHATAGIFIGSGYQFNVEAARFIIEELAPRLPSVLFVIAGGAGDSLPEGCRSRVRSNVRITGLLSDADKLLYLQACDIALNPMFGGSGTNIKMFDYMAAGLPVVTTAIGARGIVSSASPAFILSTPENFARWINVLVHHRSVWQQMSAAGRRLVTELYSWERISANLGLLLQRRHRLLSRPKPDTSIITIARGHDQLGRLAALQEEFRNGLELIVLDQEQKPWTGRERRQDSDLLYLHASFRNSFAALNLGAMLAQGEILVFIGEDVIPDSNWLLGLRACFRRTNLAAVAAHDIVPEVVIGEFAIWREAFNQAGGFLPLSGDQRIRMNGNWTRERREDGRVHLIENPASGSLKQLADISEWLGLSPAEFVRQAAASILGGEPDSNMVDALVGQLESRKCDKSAVVTGLLRLAANSGRFLEFLPPMPQVFQDEDIFLFSLQDLLSYDGAAFVDNAYRQLLRRAPDPVGLEANTRPLLEGSATKVGIIQSLLDSEEASRLGVKIVGLDVRLPSSAVPGAILRGGTPAAQSSRE